MATETVFCLNRAFGSVSRERTAQGGQRLIKGIAVVGDEIVTRDDSNPRDGKLKFHAPSGSFRRKAR